MKHWLTTYWVAGAGFMAAALLAIGPLLPASLWLIFLHSPAYMIHQIEEHWGDRFRSFVNARLFGGREVLTTEAVLWINLPGVWGVNLAALYAAWLVAPGFGLAAPYLAVVNGLSHLGVMLRFRSYNPGLWTSLGVFLPLGLTTLAVVPASLAQHLLGLAIAVAIHAAIVVHVARRSAAWTSGLGPKSPGPNGFE